MTELKTDEDIYLSIIISFYNEGDRIEKTLEDIDAFVRKQKYRCEVILSDDRSTDHSIAIARKFADEIDHFEYLEPAPGQGKGKGAGIKRGISCARGKYIMFMDADSSTPIGEIDKLLPYIKDYDIVAGSRYIREPRPYHPNYFYGVFHGIKSVFEVLIYGHSKDYQARGKQGRIRQFISRGGNLAFTVLLNQSYIDQRCGFKLYRKHIAKFLASLQTIDWFGFDTEYWAIAQKYKFKTIEVPINWYDSAEGAKVHAVKDTFSSFRDIGEVIWNLWTGKYSKKNVQKKLGETYEEHILNWE